MIVRIASTFTDALARLAGQEQKAAKLAAFDLQQDPTGKGLSMHRVERSRDTNFWTARASRDLRLVVHRTADSLLIAWVGHHDDAYAWAERRRIEVHPRTGSAQFVELVERSLEAATARQETPHANASTEQTPGPLAALLDDALLDIGVPPDWLQAVRDTAEDELFDLFDRLPQEAAEALLEYATSGSLGQPAKSAPSADPFTHPDAERRFRTIDNLDELKAALEYPWDKWAVFLHPVQRALVERDWSGPARVAGTAGTGKTIVALHRAAHLARHDAKAQILLTTFSAPLAHALAAKLRVLAEAEPDLPRRITVKALRQVAYDWYSEVFGQPQIASEAQVGALVAAAKKEGAGEGMTPEFLIEEWHRVVDAWQVPDAESYAAVPRLGRKTRLGPKQRDAAWTVFAAVRKGLAMRKLTSWPSIFARLTEHLEQGGLAPFTHAVVDEAQDLSVAEARFLAALGKRRPDGLFFAGDLGQRIFQLPFSWKSLGLDVRGRSHALKVNYRTSHQIRTAADRLLPAVIADMDGVEEGRRGTVSMFDGPPPDLQLAIDEDGEVATVAAFVRACVASGMSHGEICILFRSSRQAERARTAARQADAPFVELSDARDRDPARLSLATMHQAKGLEFRAVAVMACDEDALPDPDRLANVGDEADLEEAFDTERHLLYVACTRARDRLLISGVAPGSEFLADLQL